MEQWCIITIRSAVDDEVTLSSAVLPFLVERALPWSESFYWFYSEEDNTQTHSGKITPLS